MQDKSTAPEGNDIHCHNRPAPVMQDLGLSIPRICLPNESVDQSVWPVIACDQYTSQPEYWLETEAIVAGRPSTLDLVLPELFLEESGKIPVDQRIRTINQTMAAYLQQEILIEQQPGCILVDRKTPLHNSRKGLVIAVDLEQYDYTPGNKKRIRATEGTVLERIPPRQAIRRHAALELPHVQLLIDDPGRTVIEPLWEAVSPVRPLYDLDLMQNGGHLRGWFVPQSSLELDRAFVALSCLETLSQDNLLFAVGDGNHSLATAQAHWHEIREQVDPEHPARYALVEIINIHDDGLAFEPIHRAVFGIETDSFMVAARRWIRTRRQGLSEAGQEMASIHELPVLSDGNPDVLSLPLEEGRLVTAEVQMMLDELIESWQQQGRSVKIDYIHGQDAVQELAAKGAIGLLLPPFAKNQFFSTIARDGILPRKTFSMGESFEKRYYFECRKIVRDTP